MKETITIPSSILTNDVMTASEKLIMIYILGKGETKIVPKEIMEALNLSDNTVYKSLKGLCNSGYLYSRPPFRGGYRLPEYLMDGENGG